MARGTLTTPKSGESRRVDMSRELHETLQALQLDRQLEAVTHQPEPPSRWVFCDDKGQQWHHNFVRLKFFRLLKRGGIRRCDSMI